MGESLARIAELFESKNLGETWIAQVKAKYDESFHPELVPAGFQWHLAKVLNEPHTVATDLPTWLIEDDLDTIWESLYTTTLWLYLATRNDKNNGNFLVLHLITSLWGLEQVSRVLDQDTTREALGHFY